MFQKYLDAALNYLEQPPVMMTLGAIAILYGIYFLIRSSCKPIRLYNNESGHVHVTKSAMMNLIANTCERVGLEGKPSVSIKKARGKLALRLKIKINAGDCITEVSERLQEELLQSFNDVLGFNHIGNVDIVVTGFKGPRKNGSRQGASSLRTPPRSDESVGEPFPSSLIRD